MTKKKPTKELVKEAVEAHADLNIFAAVVAMLEGGTVSSGAQPDDFAIIRICRRAQQKCLRRYDRALEALGVPYRGGASHPDEQRAVKETK